MRRQHDEQTDFDPKGPASLSELPPGRDVQRFKLIVVEGPDNGETWSSTGDHCTIGSHLSNDLVLKDRTVSRFHCEIVLEESGSMIKDLESRNGTLLDGVRVDRAWLRAESVLRIGRTSLTFHLVAERTPLRLWPRAFFGTLVGRSVAMRAVFAEMDASSTSDATVLIDGETGTGKEEVARSIHEQSRRCDGPFVVVDCGSIPANLLESELFGHERGAFTHAISRRIGAFSEANGGSVFLDEIGEMPIELQPKVLRVLESRTVRPIGSNTQQPIDIRVIAATNRNLRREVNEGRFRPDLYYRLAVLKLTLPPLRQRPDDIPLLVEHFLGVLETDPLTAAAVVTPELLTRMQYAAWPGNVRELRNYLERCLVLQHTERLEEAEPSETVSSTSVAEDIDPHLSYQESRRRALDIFEKRYLKALINHNKGNISKAALAAGINRTYFYRLLSRHGLKR